MKNSMKIPPPAGIRKTVLDDPSKVLRVATVQGQAALIVFDADTNAGGIFVEAVGIWNLHTPISFLEFVAAIEGNIERPRIDAFERWCLACAGPATAPAGMTLN